MGNRNTHIKYCQYLYPGIESRRKQILGEVETLKYKFFLYKLYRYIQLDSCLKIDILDEKIFIGKIISDSIENTKLNYCIHKRYYTTGYTLKLGNTKQIFCCPEDLKNVILDLKTLKSNLLDILVMVRRGHNDYKSQLSKLPTVILDNILYKYLFGSPLIKSEFCIITLASKSEF